MLFELTNEQRRYFSLPLIGETWDKVKFNDTTFLYFDGDSLVRIIYVTENTYFERQMNVLTAENRTIVLPKTEKGKPKKLNYTSLEAMTPIGVYFRFDDGRVTIGNFSTQTTFYSSYCNEEKIENLEQWIGRWIDETTADDLKSIDAFSMTKRRHCRYQEGDFFTFKIGRRQYGFGRILLEVAPIRKAIENGKINEKHYGLTNLMGKALIIKVYKNVSNSAEVDLNELKHYEAFLSTPIMDNCFYYGEYKIIGNQSLEPFELEFPISYSKSINFGDLDTIYLQYGLIYKETRKKKFSRHLSTLEGGISGNNPYRFEAIGFSITSELGKLKGLETPMWKDKYDLRNPENATVKREIFEFFGLDPDKSYYENYVEYQRT